MPCLLNEKSFFLANCKGCCSLSCFAQFSRPRGRAV
jgi:hypothetical protein